MTAVNYADRATLSIAGSELSKQLGLSKVVMGYAFSAFGWAYVIGQIPGGWLLDRFGSTDLALAAYNAGPTAVAKRGGAPNSETLTYVGNVNEIWRLLHGCS